MTYLNHDEIVSAIQILAHQHPELAEDLELPNLTQETRTVHGMLLGRSRAPDKPTVILVGGIHAREWVPPDALVSLAADLIEAGSRGTGLRYGGAQFSSASIASILDNIQLAIVACANPDGRVYSQAIDPNWRKNRRPMPTAGGACYGVDINRNFDVAWDFRRYFAEGAVSASADPCHPNLYVGPSAASEPETRNIAWLFDAFPGTRVFVDVHSAIPAVFHSWGLDGNQSSNPQQNFLNPVFDGQRGRPDPEYGEYIPHSDLNTVQRLAGLMRNTITLVAGDSYDIGPAFDLYATSGASDDYAYSRHFKDPAKPKVLGFTMECGHEFQPAEPRRSTVIAEVSAALLALCADVSGSIS
jgi:murein tripeptide amidase MpaA